MTTLIWILFYCGIALTGVALVNIYLGFSVKNWPSTTGKVVVSEIQVGNNPFGSEEKFFQPIVIYEYSANGKTYRSKRLGNFLWFGGDRKFAEDVVGKFGRNSQTKIYYHWLFPSVSALIPGLQQPVMHLLILFTGAVGSVSFGARLFS